MEEAPKWNLVDEISLAAASATDTRRHFFVPLASIPIGQTSVRAVDRTMYSFSETYTTLPAPDGRTSDVSLNIQIQIPTGGLSDENANPDPLIRLHATDCARIRFEPAGDGLQDRLVLQMLTFPFLHTPLITGVPRWFQRWEDAVSIPLTLIYENIDRTLLEALLNGITAPVATSSQNQVGSTKGLSFPADVTPANKATFITQFLAGAADHEIYAEAGSVIGTAATDPADSSRRLLKLHCRYQDHTAADPHPMNVRELFHLLFGDSSTEAKNHPLLLRLNETGKELQANIHPETRRFLLRPPLRTWKRVEWEAKKEINEHSISWCPAGELGTNRFCNNHRRQVGTVTRTFNNGAYRDSNKCNLFTSDICLRAGFCAVVHPVGRNLWHFHDANSHTNNIHRVTGQDARIAITGSGDDANRTWAWKIENELRAQPAGQRQAFLNRAMQGEGRCLILAGARARRFIRRKILPGPPAVWGIADCAASLRRNGIGHIIIVTEVRAEPQLHATVGGGLQRIEVSTWEASGEGAVNGNFTAQLGGAAGAAAGGTGFIRLHLFELQPGGDPDTVQGLRSLNVQNVHRNLLETANEAAAPARLTHTPAGAPLPATPAPGNCCRDNHPPSNAATTTVPC